MPATRARARMQWPGATSKLVQDLSYRFQHAAHDGDLERVIDHDHARARSISQSSNRLALLFELHIDARKTLPFKRSRSIGEGDEAMEEEVILFRPPASASASVASPPGPAAPSPPPPPPPPATATATAHLPHVASTTLPSIPLPSSLTTRGVSSSSSSLLLHLRTQDSLLGYQGEGYEEEEFVPETVTVGAGGAMQVRLPRRPPSSQPVLFFGAILFSKAARHHMVRLQEFIVDQESLNPRTKVNVVHDLHVTISVGTAPREMGDALRSALDKAVRNTECPPFHTKLADLDRFGTSVVYAKPEFAPAHGRVRDMQVAFKDLAKNLWMSSEGFTQGWTPHATLLKTKYIPKGQKPKLVFSLDPYRAELAKIPLAERWYRVMSVQMLARSEDGVMYRRVGDPIPLHGVRTEDLVDADTAAILSAF